jgi:hypothetical protein
MRLCKCGGEVREHELKGDRVAWTCNSCKRYEIIQREPLVQPYPMDLTSMHGYDPATLLPRS